jgi:predicted small lipoprotein YifL
MRRIVADRSDLLCWDLTRSDFVTSVPRRLAFLTVVLALPLALAGCGVRGTVELPPSAAVEPAAEGGKPAPRPSGTAASGTAGSTSAAVVEAPAARRRSPLDLLID